MKRRSWRDYLAAVEYGRDRFGNFYLRLPNSGRIVPIEETTLAQITVETIAKMREGRGTAYDERRAQLLRKVLTDTEWRTAEGVVELAAKTADDLAALDSLAEVEEPEPGAAPG